MPGANIAYSQWSRMWLFEAFFTAFRSVLSDSDETRIAPQAICVPLCASKVKRLRILEVGVKTKTIGGMKNLLTE